MKIFILSPNLNVLFSKEQRERLEAAGDVTYLDKIQPLEGLNNILANLDEKILAIDPDFVDWKVQNESIKKVPNLKCVCLQTTSFSWVDAKYIGELGIPVTNLRGFSTEAVAEWAFMMALNVARKVPIIIQDNWKQDFAKHQGIELNGKTAGIIGLGSIGKRIAEIAQGFGMKVNYWSRNSKDDRFNYTELDKLVQTSDVIFPAVAQNEETKGIITDKMLKSMKTSVIFVSIVHKVYNHELLLQLLKEGKIYGYANEEKDQKISDLKENNWTGVGLAWCTDGSMKRNSEQWVETIVNAAKGRYPTRVN